VYNVIHQVADPLPHAFASTQFDKHIQDCQQITYLYYSQWRHKLVRLGTLRPSRLQELSYHKQLTRLLRAQYFEGIGLGIIVTP